MNELAEHRQAALQRHLRKHLEGEVRFDAPTRRIYATDASIYQILPLGVVLPRHVRDLQAALQIAAEHRVPIVPRGGGTSLSGQAVGPGLVIDVSKYLNRILEVDVTGRRCRVQPGVVLSQLNAAVAMHGLQFGPDVSTANRATLGGMIGNNSAGAHSIVFGKTVDHVRALRAFLVDGTLVSFSAQPIASLAALSDVGDREAKLALDVLALLRTLEAEIENRFPKILRRVSGYNLPELASQLRRGEINLASLLVGSEGTLGFFAEAEVNLVPLPAARGLLVPHFSSREAALDAVLRCLELRPSAVELLDRMILDLARANLGLRDRMAAIQGRPACVLMVEFAGDSAAEVSHRLDLASERLTQQPGMTALVRAETDAEREPLWRLREAGLPLLMGLPGDRKPVTFVEDTAVPTDRLPEFARRFEQILASHGTSGAFYGHASVGCLHIRPLLNLKDPADVATMARISDEITGLVLEFGGSLSGEHGDGLARSLWNRRLFGDSLYGCFQRIKRCFDPESRLNPGKIVDGPPLTEHLRLGGNYHAHEPPTAFHYPVDHGFAHQVELCSGTGVCRKTSGGMMCPSYRATREEVHSTRGRANALRWAMSQPPDAAELRSRWLMEVMDLCLSCKACKSECPSNVDMTKLKAEVMHLHYAHRGRPLSHRLLAHLPLLLRLAASVAPVVNFLARTKPSRWLLERALGIDARRSLPALHASHLRRWFWWHRPHPHAGKVGRVLFLDDCFTTYQEPAIGRAAVRLLELAGYRVARLGICCGRPLFSKGMLDEGRQLVQVQASRLDALLRPGVPIVGVEPSCLLSLVDEWPDVVPSPATQRLAAAAYLVDDWLEAELHSGKTGLHLRPRPGSAVLHGHCHQRTLIGLHGSENLLRRIPELKLSVLDDGCCGMAGSFGFEREHYDLSMAIAELSVAPAVRAAGEALILATGTSCRHQIADATGRKSLHPLELLLAQAEAMPASPS